MGWLIESYLSSRKFADLAPATRTGQRRDYDWLRKVAGHYPFAQCRTRDVSKLMDLKAGAVAANTVAKRLSSLFAYAQSLDLMTHNPARHAERRKVAGDGFHTATAAEVEAFRARHPTGTRERLSLELAINTGAARQDLARLGWQNVTGDAIRYTRHKTKVEAVLPILPDLAAELAQVPRDRLQFLITAEGRPFTVAGFGNAFRDWCDLAGLPGCTAHSFRKFAATRLAEAGASEFEVMSVLAHSTPKEAARYVAKARRETMGAAALARLPGADGERNLSNPVDRLDKPAPQGAESKAKNA